MHEELQVTACLPSPVQFIPPYNGVGLLQILELVFIFVPLQSQEEKSLQFPQPPSTKI